MSPWFSPFLYGGAVFLYLFLLRMWQPEGTALTVWRLVAMVIAIGGAYVVHTLLLPPIGPGGMAR